MNRAKSSGFLVFVTIAAAFGGLLFGYDTAVISGAVEPIRMHFIDPLFQDPMQASRVVIEFKNTLLLSTLLVLALSIYYFMRLYGRIRGLVFAAIVSAITGWLFYRQVFILPDEITPNLANSITGFTIASALLGCVIGGFFAGYISQRLGRRNGLILAALLFIVSAIGSALPEVVNVFGIEHISAFNLYRIIGGIGVGIALCFRLCTSLKLHPVTCVVGWCRATSSASSLACYWCISSITSLPAAKLRNG
nr:MFS transporter [Pseudomonas luteola]